MALDPLKFAVAIQDEATGQLEKIQREFEKLKDKTVTVNVTGIEDLRNLLSALQHQQVSNLGKEVSLGIKGAAEGLQKEAQDAVRASLGKLAEDLATVKQAIQHDNFTAFSERILKCANAVEVLDAAFKKFHVTIGQDEGMRNFMSGLGEVIRNVRSTMGTLEVGKNGGIGGLADNYERNVQRIEDAMRRVREMQLTLGNRLEKANASGIGTDNRYIYMLDAYQHKLEQIRRDEEVMHGKGWTADNGFKDMLRNADTYIKYLDRQMQKQQTIETNQRRYNTALEEMQKLLIRLDAASSKAFYLHTPNTNINVAIQDVEKFIDKLLQLDKKSFGNNHVINELIAEYTRLKSTMTAVAREQEKLNKTTERENTKTAKANAKQAQKENEQWAESMRRAGVEATKLEIQIRKLHEAESRGKVAKIDTTNLSARIAELQNFVNILRSIENGSRSYGHTRDFINSVPVQNSIRFANEEASAVRQATAEKEKAARASQQLTAEEQRLSWAMNQTTNSAKGQSQILGELKSMAAQYLGVWGGQQFLHNIIEIGGQLEMQRLSIGAILQNTAQANELFDKIKNLAVKSPFGVVELDQMTKQLTAYGFKYNELYDMTKRLADISAATGTGVDRLALALGHVRSEGALSGYTLRQFSMGNIPLLEKLSQKLGKTKKEIREMTRKKEIDYEDVVGVLKDLTNEGGMFYNMQEVISDSVKAKFKNVKDAMDIMYGEMAEGALGGSLKKVANVLMELTQNWKDVATVMGVVGASWVVHKAAMLSYNQVIGTSNASILKSISLFRTKEAEQLRSASLYRTLTSVEKSQIATSKLLTVQERIRMALHIPLTANQRLRIQYARQQHVMDLVLAISEKKLTAEDIARQVALGKLTKAEAVQIIALSDLNAAQKAAALEAINNTRVLGFFGKAGYAAALGVKALGTALKSLIFNPATLSLAAVTTVMELWMRNKREMEQAAEIADSIRERSNSAMLATRNIIESSKIEFTDSEGNKLHSSNLDLQSIANINAKVSVKFDRDEAQQLIDEWTNYIRQYSATPNKILNEALFDEEGMRSIEEQFERLKEVIAEIVKAQYGLHDVGDIFENATEATDTGIFGGAFNDNVVTNINDYEKSLKKYNKAFADLYKNHGRGVDSIVKAVEKENSAFASAVSGMSTYGEKFKYLIENMKDFQNAYGVAYAAVGNSDNDLLDFLYKSQYGNFSEKHELNADMEKMNDDLDLFFTHIESELNTRGLEIGKLSEAQQQDLLLGFTDFLSKTKVTTSETLDYLKQKFAERFQLKLDVDDEKFQVKVNEVLRILKELSGSDWNVNIEFASNVNDVISEARKQYKTAKEYYENAEPILLKYGIKMKMGDVLSEGEISEILYNASKVMTPEGLRFLEQVLKGANEASRIFNQSTAASENGGFELEEKKKKDKTTGEKSYKDKESEVWQQRIKLIQEARREYDYWEKKIGKDAAQEKVKSQFANLIGADKILQPGDLDNLEKYAEVLRKIEEEIKARYEADKKLKSGQKKDTNIANDIKNLRELANALYNIGKGEFERASENFVSKITADIEELTEKWEIFNMVRKATGDVELAGSAAGISPIGDTIGTVADAMRYELMEQLEKAGGEGVAATIPLDVHLDERSIREQLEKAIPLDESIDSIDTYRTKIEGLLKVYQEWQKLQKQVVKDDLQIFSELIGSAVDLQSEVLKIQRKYQDRKDVINRLRAEDKEGTNTQKYDQYEAIAAANRDAELIQATKEYKMLMDGVVTMSENAAETIKGQYIAALKVQLDKGAISAKTYADRIKEINEKTSALRNYKGDFFSFFTGGLEGLFQNKIKRGQSEIEKGALTGDNKLIEIGKELVETANKQLDRLGFIDKLVHGIDGIVQGSNSIFQNIRKMYDDIGIDTHSNGFSTANIVLSSLSAISNGTTKSLEALMRGDSMGAAAAVTEEATGLVSAIAKEHDDDLSDEIEKLQALADAIEANTEAIKRSRQRLFGYDRGSIGLLTYYRSKYNDDDDVNNAMRDFYKSYGNSGYTKELQNLKDEREKYMEMYNKEADKKDESKTTLEEYKSKIAELDDQIRFFAEDLAKELWSIDIKGWADQFSDALSSAFENGEDMMKAFNDTAKSIMQSVVNEMLKIGIIEPMIEKLRNRLFGYTNKDGNFVNGIVSADELTENPSNASKKVLNEIANYFKPGGEGNKMVQVAQEYLTGVDALLQQLGYSKGLRNDDDDSNTLSASIQGTTEETSDLLAGYVNALRQDVAMNRLLLTEFVAQFLPEYNEAFMNHVRAVSRIDGNVQAVMEMMRYGSGALYDEIRALRARVDNVVDGAESFAMR